MNPMSWPKEGLVVAVTEDEDPAAAAAMHLDLCEACDLDESAPSEVFYQAINALDDGVERLRDAGRA